MLCSGILPPIFSSLPSHLQDDVATLNRFRNLVDAVDALGTLGSYAGWIVRESLREAVEREDVRALESLMTFLRQGGPVEELERRLSPQSSWASRRFHRWENIRHSDAPLARLKAEELNDRGLRLHGRVEAGIFPILWAGQDTAYLSDWRTKRTLSILRRKTPGLLDEKNAEKFYEESRRRLTPFASGGPVDKSLLVGAFLALGDGISRGVAERIQDEAYDLQVLSGTDFVDHAMERYEREGRSVSPDPNVLNAIYFGRGSGLDREILVRARPLGLSWNLGEEGLLRELMALSVHEDLHHLDHIALGSPRTEEDLFAFELRAHAVEFLWRASHGDPRELRRFTEESFLGFGMAFRDYYEGL